jgi:hypothetical protein
MIGIEAASARSAWSRASVRRAARSGRPWCSGAVHPSDRRRRHPGRPDPADEVWEIAVTPASRQPGVGGCSTLGSDLLPLRRRRLRRLGRAVASGGSAVFEFGDESGSLGVSACSGGHGAMVCGPRASRAGQPLEHVRYLVLDRGHLFLAHSHLRRGPAASGDGVLNAGHDRRRIRGRMLLAHSRTMPVVQGDTHPGEHCAGDLSMDRIADAQREPARSVTARTDRCAAAPGERSPCRSPFGGTVRGPVLTTGRCWALAGAGRWSALTTCPL